MEYENIPLNYQSYDWSCGLAALCVALNEFNINTSEDKIKHLLAKKKAHLLDEGFLMSDTGLACQLYGLRTKFKIPGYTKSYMKIVGHTKKIRQEINDKMSMKLESDIRYRFESLLKYINNGGKVQCFANEWRPCYCDIHNALKNGSVVIAEVDCVEYYDIKDEYWSHSIVLIPWKGQFKLFDPYRKRGQNDYDNWERHVEYSDKFDWQRWRGYLLELCRN